MTEERVEDLVGADTMLYCRVGWNRVPVVLRASCKRGRAANAGIDASFVEIVLEETLQIRHKGGRRSSLDSVRCHVPALDKRQADSLNEAYRVISEVFEPTRRSKGGNVFLNVYFFDQTRGLCRPLDELRGGLPFLPQ